MLKAIRIPLSVLIATAIGAGWTVRAAWAAGSGEGKVLVPADPADDPQEAEVLIREEEPPKKVIRKIRTVREVRKDSAAAAAGSGQARTQVNTINVYGAAAASGSADSLAAKARRDSLAMAEKSRRDSAALAESARKLAEERSLRGDMEKQLLTTGLLVLDAVYFETARTDISINSEPYLDMLAKMLAKYPKLRLEVAGHTDHVGSEAYNQRLSQGRAAAVKGYLAAAEPSLAGRLTARGYGESSPKADNNTAEGRMRNRRTELQVMNKEALEEYNRPGAQALGPTE
jgi:outer membrane protein OmpA-like peptidoglycan-associated protein